MLKRLRRSLLMILAVLPFVATAAPTAHQVVESTSSRLLADLTANKAQYKQDPTAFYNALNEILGPVVDAEGISRSIMTVKYANRASDAQIKRFEENFKRSLMQFYGNALLSYNNQDIRVLPATGKADPERATVNMEVRDEKGTVYPVAYTMVNKDGAWLLRNVVINGINIGKLFRDQFAQAMQQNRNNLDKTIDGWGEIVAKAKAETES